MLISNAAAATVFMMTLALDRLIDRETIKVSQPCVSAPSISKSWRGPRVLLSSKGMGQATSERLTNSTS
jgi:hypothetical protein